MDSLILIIGFGFVFYTLAWEDTKKEWKRAIVPKEVHEGLPSIQAGFVWLAYKIFGGGSCEE